MGGDNVTHTLVSLSRGAGAACADRLPDTFSFFPVNGCSSDRESGSLRLPGGWGSWARVGRWSAPRRRSLGSARRRVLASGEGRLVPTSSRILFHLSRLIGAVPAANRVGRGCRAWAVGYRALERAHRDVDHCLPCGAGRARAALERLVPTSSRILFHLSRLIGAVPAVNRVAAAGLGQLG